ncbi:MAG: hypothetical protein IH584_06465 [Candidatus Aminicenantes bacterium]|nr:hypothetical protein [Candidatus Aminicenantes bacterium]
MGNFKILGRAMILSFRKRRLAVRLWTVNILFSLFAVTPFFFLIMKHMSHSFSAEHTLQKLDIFWLADFIYRYMNVTPAVLGSALLAAVLYLLLSVFLNGGIIGCLNRQEAKTTLADFFHDCGLYFWRFFRLFLFSIPVYLIFIGIFYPLLKAFLEIFRRRAPTEWPAMIVSNLRFLVLVLLLTVVAMFFDYIKIGLVTGARKKVLKETWLTLKFMRRGFFKAWGLYLLAGLVFVALTFFYLEIVRLLPKNRPLLVLLVFLWQQFYVLCRQWSKVLFFATEIEFTRENMGKTG